MPVTLINHYVRKYGEAYLAAAVLSESASNVSSSCAIMCSGLPAKTPICCVALIIRHCGVRQKVRLIPHELSRALHLGIFEQPRVGSIL